MQATLEVWVLDRREATPEERRTGVTEGKGRRGGGAWSGVGGAVTVCLDRFSEHTQRKRLLSGVGAPFPFCSIVCMSFLLGVAGPASPVVN